MKYTIGLGKQNMTCFIPGVGMLGYGQHHNTVKEIGTPLWARTLILNDQKQRFILVHLEQCLISIAIKEEVLKRINLLYPEWEIGDKNLAITAQHTHSAPGGYSHYPFYNFTIPNFQIKIFDKIVSSIIDSIEEAAQKTEEVSLSWGDITIDPSKEVAFNRSWMAHALNPDAQYLTEEERHLAVDRTMEGMFFKNKEGKILAFLNWFGVHCTSVSSYNNKIHHDNKGIAAELFEKQYPGTIAFFLQSSAGDVSPNFVWDKKTNLMRGKFSNQYENAYFNGEIQFREAEKISGDHAISVGLDFHQTFFDMAKEVATPAHGVAFFKGTAEGPGVSAPLGAVLQKVSKLVRNYHLLNNPEQNKAFYEAHGNKDVLLDHRTGSFLGIPLKAWKALPPLPEPSVNAFRKTAKNNALETLPWIPAIVPFQIVRLGDVLVAFVPGEISVMSGRRVKAHLLKELQPLGINKIFLTSYANGHMGYIVTPEEYDKQCYEGGHTVYGRDTLLGIIKGFDQVISSMKGEKPNEDLPKGPFHFPADELARRST